MENNEKKLPGLDAAAESAEQSIAEKTNTDEFKLQTSDAVSFDESAERVSEQRDVDKADEQTLPNTGELNASEFTPLDELLYDMEDSEDEESEESPEGYDSFLSDYRLVLSRALRGEAGVPSDATADSFAAGEETENTNGQSSDEETSIGTGAVSDDATDSDKEYDEDIIEFGEQISLLDSIDAEAVPFFFDEDLPKCGDAGLKLTVDDKIFTQEPIVDDSEKYNPDKPRKIDAAFDIIEMLVFTLLSVMIVTSFFFRHSVVDGSSMQNTLQDGDHLIICDLFYTPDYGDVIVFEDTSSAERKALVKRVIGLPGDTVEIKADGRVFLNGEELDEKYVFVDTSSGTYTDEEQTFTVGEGEVFVLGDHRNVSADSRRFGTIDEDTILGRAILRFYPFSEFGAVK